MRLLPREEKFFHFFQRQASLINEAAGLLLDGARSGNTRLAGAAEKIGELEQRGDEVIHDTFKALNQTFITPLDPEDLHSLATHLDDVLDAIEDAAHRMVDYRIDPIPQAVVDLCVQITGCTQSLEKAINALNEKKNVVEHCIEINRLEEVADGILRREVRSLFDTERDPIVIMKVKEVYEFLEIATDRCEDVADALQNIVVKNS